MSATTDRTPEPAHTPDPDGSVEPRDSVRRRRAARPRGSRQLDSTALIYLVLVAVIAVSAVLTGIEGRNFFSQGNIWAVLTAMSVLGLISIGQTLVILVGSATDKRWNGEGHRLPGAPRPLVARTLAAKTTASADVRNLFST